MNKKQFSAENAEQRWKLRKAKLDKNRFFKYFLSFKDQVLSCSTAVILDTKTRFTFRELNLFLNLKLVLA